VIAFVLQDFINLTYWERTQHAFLFYTREVKILFYHNFTSHVFINCNNIWVYYTRNGEKGQCHEIFCCWFFYESVSPQPQSVLLGPFRIFSKIRGNVRRSRLTTGINDTGGKQWEQYQAADTLKWTWRQNCIYKLTLLPKGVKTK